MVYIKRRTYRFAALSSEVKREDEKKAVILSMVREKSPRKEGEEEAPEVKRRSQRLRDRTKKWGYIASPVLLTKTEGTEVS